MDSVIRINSIEFVRSFVLLFVDLGLHYVAVNCIHVVLVIILKLADSNFSKQNDRLDSQLQFKHK